MTEKTARAEDAAAPPEATASANPSAAQQQSDAAALAAELKDRLLRTLAEMENLSQRTEREVTDARLYGVASFARDMLGVADNMRRALDAVSPELRASAEPGVKALIDGVELTERELLQGAGKERRAAVQPARGKIRSQRASGDIRGCQSFGAGGQRGRGRGAGLHDRRARIASGHGGRVEGRPENGTGLARGQRQRDGDAAGIPEKSRRVSRRSDTKVMALCRTGSFERLSLCRSRLSRAPLSRCTASAGYASTSVRRCRAPCASARARWSSRRRRRCRPFADNHRRQNAAIG